MGVSIFAEHKALKIRRIALAVMVLYFLIDVWPLKFEMRQMIAGNWDYLTGKQSETDYLLEHFEIYGSVRYLNTELEEATVLLALYEPRGYYLEHDYFWLNPANQRVIKLETIGTPDALLNRLQAMGFTHILYNPNWPQSLDEMQYSAENTRLFEDLLKTLALIQSDGAIRVYELPTPGE